MSNMLATYEADYIFQLLVYAYLSTLSLMYRHITPISLSKRSNCYINLYLMYLKCLEAANQGKATLSLFHKAVFRIK